MIEQSRMSPGLWLAITFFGAAGAATASIASLVLGILMLVPASPFETQMVTTGVIMIVFAIVGIAALIGAVAGACVGCIIYAIASLIGIIVGSCCSPKEDKPSTV